MNKEPLRAAPPGTTGRTAREIFAQMGWNKPGEPLVVAHETNSFLAYESITRAHTGDPNVLVSREGFEGEAAAFGDGFYTRVGQEGARGTGLTIRFTVDPEAREGSDFILAHREGDHYVIFRNKRAIRVIPESLNLEILDYFELLARKTNFSKSDLGILEKLKRRIIAKSAAVTPEEAEKILDIVKKSQPGSELRMEWLFLPVSTRYPEEMKTFLRAADGSWDLELIRHAAAQRHWADNIHFMQTAITGDLFAVKLAVFTSFVRSPVWPEHEHGCWMLLRLLKYSLLHGHFVHNAGFAPWHQSKCAPEIIEKISLRDPHGIIKYVLQHEGWEKYPQLLQKALDLNDPDADRAIVEEFLTRDHWYKAHPEFLQTILSRKVTASRWQRLVSRDTDNSYIARSMVDRSIAEFLLAEPRWADRPEGLEALKILVERGTADEELQRHVLSQPYWRNHPGLLQLTGGEPPTLKRLKGVLAGKRDCQGFFSRLLR